MLIYAKNMAGDVLPLTLPSFPSPSEEDIHRCLAEIVCPDDPTRLVLLDHIPAPPACCSKEPLVSDETLSSLIEELHELGLHELGFQEEKEEWNEGDIVEYMVKDPEYSVRILEKQYTLFTLEDDTQENPYFQIDVLVRKGNVTHRPGHLDLDCVYTYPFLFSIRDGMYYPPSTWKIQEDDGYPYIQFIASMPIGFSCLQKMLERETDTSGHISRIRRAIRRKWIRFLRRKGQATEAERRVEALHSSELFPGEKRRWKELYWATKVSSLSS